MHGQSPHVQRAVPDCPRVLVLGASGRLGAILRRLWPPGISPDAGRAPFAPVWQTRRPFVAASATAAALVLDPLGEPAALARAVADADVVLSLAGPTRPDADHGLHAELAEAVLDARERAGRRIPVLLISSAAVYGPCGGSLQEDATCEPGSDYGRGKLVMERSAAGTSDAVHVLRLGNVAGADALLGGVVPGRGVVLDRFADGATPSRSYIGPIALARVLGWLSMRAMSGQKLPGVLNVAAGQVEMAALLDAAGVAWVPRSAPPNAIREVRLDTGRLDAMTSLAPAARTAVGMVAEWRRSRLDDPHAGGR